MSPFQQQQQQQQQHFSSASASSSSSTRPPRSDLEARSALHAAQTLPRLALRAWHSSSSDARYEKPWHSEHQQASALPKDCELCAAELRQQAMAAM
eukprot:2107403-Rhodomonas_salina.2